MSTMRTKMLNKADKPAGTVFDARTLHSETAVALTFGESLFREQRT